MMYVTVGHSRKKKMDRLLFFCCAEIVFFTTGNVFLSISHFLSSLCIIFENCHWPYFFARFFDDGWCSGGWLVFFQKVTGTILAPHQKWSSSKIGVTIWCLANRHTKQSFGFWWKELVAEPRQVDDDFLFAASSPPLAQEKQQHDGWLPTTTTNVILRRRDWLTMSTTQSVPLGPWTFIYFLGMI